VKRQRREPFWRTLWRAWRVPLPNRFWRAAMVPLTLLVIGTLGYPLIEGEQWSYFDGFYMTAITLTTIGYGETHPLSVPGRLFTVVLAYSGVFTLFYLATEAIRTILSGELQEYLGRQRMEEDLARLTDHLIVCGFGRMGKIVCDELARQGRTFVIIDTHAHDPVTAPYLNGIWLHGNATEDEVLRKAGVERAKALITVVGSDADNLYITLSARLLNPKLKIVARAEEEEAEFKLRRVGATKVISPYLAGGHRAVQAVLRPTVLHFMEMATRPEFLDLSIEEVTVDPGSRLAGQSLRDSRVNQDLGVIVVGLQLPGGELLYSPTGDAVIEPGAVILALGQRRQLDRLEEVAKANEKP
jgi:voltage-gated potassium channel